MAEVHTPWGYRVTLEGGETAIPPLLDVSAFRTLSGNRLSSTDDTIAAKLAAVSSAVRDWCGWHVAPVMECACELDGGGRTLWLPAMGIRSVGSVSVCGEERDGYEWAERGELRLARPTPDRLRAVAVRFAAGYEAAATQAIAQVVCQLTENAVTATPGLREEHAGQVGATYNQTESGVSGGVRLLPSDMAALGNYRIITA